MSDTEELTQSKDFSVFGVVGALLRAKGGTLGNSLLR